MTRPRPIRINLRPTTGVGSLAQHSHRPVVLITGGAGYIGSHVVHALGEAGIPCVVVDDLSTGRRDLVPADVPFLQGDARDRAIVAPACARHGVTAIMHFAGSIVVPESVANPLGYYRNNTCTSRALIETAVAAGVPHFIFSSTAAVYGEPDRVPIDEEAPTRPISPYGTSKLMTEWMLRDAARAHDIGYVALRYFNVAGADPRGRAGQTNPAATHLIKVACETVLGKRPEMVVFGTDYATPDGSCIRDYIHVSDLAAAHVRALEYLAGGGASRVLNCGYGHGHSVLEVVRAVEAAAGSPLAFRVGGRRAGDMASLVADPTRIRELLGWRPGHDDLATIVATALEWERRLPARPASRSTA